MKTVTLSGQWPGLTIFVTQSLPPVLRDQNNLHRTAGMGVTAHSPHVVALTVQQLGVITELVSWDSLCTHPLLSSSGLELNSMAEQISGHVSH